MKRRSSGFNARRYARNQETRFIIGFFVLLYSLGGALIWLFYGTSALLLGWLCMTAGLLFFLLIYGIISFVGWWAGE